MFTCLLLAIAINPDGQTIAVELVIKDIPLIAFCHNCQEEYKPEIGMQYSCPDCKSPMEDIRSGRELKIDRIEYSSAANCL